MKYLLLLLSLLINTTVFSNYENTCFLRKKLALDEEKVKSVSLKNFHFRPFSDSLYNVFNKDIELLLNEIKGDINISSVKIFFYSEPAFFLPERKKSLSLVRANKVKSILIEKKIFDPEIVTVKVIEKKIKSRIIDIINDEDNIEVKIYYTNKVSSPISINSNEINDSNKPAVKKLIENEPITSFKIYKFPIVLREADIVIVSVKDSKNNLITKFSKKVETRGKVEIDVPLEKLMVGVYTISLISLNGAISKNQLDIRPKK